MALHFPLEGTDNVLTTLSSTVALRTRAIWFRITQTGAITNYGRLFAKGTPGTAVEEQCRWMDDVNKIEFRQAWTSAGAWTITAPSQNVWHHLMVVYNYGDTANNPLIWLDGSPATVTVGSVPSGTVTTGSGAYTIGNIYTTSDGFGGDLAHWAIWSRELGQVEATALAAGMSPMVLNVGLEDYVPLTTDATSLVRSSGSVSGTTVVVGPTMQVTQGGDIFKWPTGKKTFESNFKSMFVYSGKVPTVGGAPANVILSNLVANFQQFKGGFNS